MSGPIWLYQIVYVVRFVFFLALVYLALGWLVERYSRNPESQVKGFFRLLGSPVTRPIARRMDPDTPYSKVLGRSLGIITGIWLALHLVLIILR